MPCVSCAERRLILAAAVRKDGAAGVVKAVPQVAVHLVRDLRQRLGPKPR
jgi:hypothetical protein